MTNAIYGTFLYGEALYGEIDSAIYSVVPSYLGLRINFLSPMVKDIELLNPENYTITPANPVTSVDFGCLEVIPEDEDTPAYVDLVMTDCTHNRNYTLVIVPDKIRNVSNVYVTSGNNTAAFVGVSELPDVLLVQSISPTLMRVNFSKTMAVNEDLKNKDSYVFTGDLKVLKVEIETASSVLLTTSRQSAGQIYDLTIV